MTEPPNILVVVADQLAAAGLGSYGNPLTRAPTLDRLAGEGVVFEHAYCASPLCVPSRGSLLTSMLPSRTGAIDNGAELAASVPTFAHYLRVLGYRTVLAGKMHFVGPDQMHGFEERVTADVYPAGLDWVPDWNLSSSERLPWYHDMSSVQRAGAVRASLQLDYDEEVAFRARRAIVDSARARAPRPLLLVASFTHPHDPYEVPARLWESYADATVDPPAVPTLPLEHQDPHSRRLLEMFDHERFPADLTRTLAARRAYSAAISLVDEHVASMLATLEDVGMTRDTIVIVTSDHGDMLGERGLWYKMSFFDGSARIPLIVHRPGRIAPRRVATPVSLLDLVPTLVDLAGGWPDGTPAAPIEGRSLLGFLGDGPEPPPEPVLAEYLAEGVVEPQVMVRHGSYKLIRCPGDPDLLYDLADDPHERENLADRPAGRAELDALGQIADARWNLPALRHEVLASQQRRRLVARALATGIITRWDHVSPDDAPDRYISSGRDFWGALEQSRLAAPEDQESG
jgi:choline-sulfatase